MGHAVCIQNVGAGLLRTVSLAKNNHASVFKSQEPLNHSYSETAGNNQDVGVMNRPRATTHRRHQSAARGPPRGSYLTPQHKLGLL